MRIDDVFSDIKEGSALRIERICVSLERAACFQCFRILYGDTFIGSRNDALLSELTQCAGDL